MKSQAILLACFAVAIAPLSALARPGVLFAETPGATINIRTRPALDSTSIYLGRPGDRITVIEQSQASGTTPWYYIQFEGSDVAGWVRGDLVSFSNSITPQSTTAVPGVPSEAVDACQNRAFIALNTFRNDIDITQSRTDSNGLYDVSWRQASTETTGRCTVNAAHTVVEFVTNQLASSPTQPSQPQITLHTFRTEAYNVRLYRVESVDSPQTYINLFDIDDQALTLQNEVVRSDAANGVTVFWTEKDGREYQVRLLPDNQYMLRISTSSGVEYEGYAAIAGVFP